MKLILLFLFLSLSTFSQTKLDTLLFNKVNEYRVSKNLKELKWDTSAYKATKHHTLYLAENKFNSPKFFLELTKKDRYSTSSIIIKSLKYPHREDSIIFNLPSDRYKYYGGNYNYIGEIIAGMNKSIKSDDSLKFEKLSIEILNGWKNSPEHNKILLIPNITKGGCSTIIEIIEQGIKNYKIYFTTSTFLVNY